MKAWLSVNGRSLLQLDYRFTDLQVAKSLVELRQALADYPGARRATVKRVYDRLGAGSDLSAGLYHTYAGFWHGLRKDNLE